ncbi:hypothetical protein KFK09_015099 [Dendrobium nobile]|uniref:Transposase n=1 Tax=Dendrobium nobile TaxID=94219 RepID=A0A8T3B501_DENNO|nr:hypothetical protein KFK09_015099 [Dendrobium nobile]
MSELWGIKEMLDDNCLHGSAHIRDMARKMKDKFDKYWGDCNLLISLGAILDPRNKMKMISFAFNSMYTENIAQVHITDIRESLNELYNEYVEDYKIANAEKNTVEETNSNYPSSSSIRGRPLYGKRKYETYIRTDYTTHVVKSELDVYLDDGVFIEEENPIVHFDCLEWWKANNLKYRILSRMACDILSIPITTVASEATFSAGGRVIDQYRSSLGTETVQHLICGSDWYRNLYGIKRKVKV